MLWVHLIAGVGLLIGYFQVIKKKEHYGKKTVRRVFFLAAAGNLLGAVLTVGAGTGLMAEDEIRRGALGSQPVKENWTVSVDNGEEHTITIEVPPREYSEEEIRRAFDDAAAFLERSVAGENESLQHVEYALNLPAELPDSPVSVFWSTDRPLLVDSRGMLSDEIPEEGADVTLEATLELQNQTSTFSRRIRVYPPKKEEEEQLLLDIQKAVREENPDAGSDVYRLPASMDGHTLSWSRQPDRTGLQILLLSLGGAGVCWAASIHDAEQRRRKREEQMMQDYPEIISEMVLLLGAGLGMRRIFERMVRDYNRRPGNGDPKRVRYAYEELRLTLREMENGVPEQEAYEHLGIRSGVAAYRTLSTLLTQNLKKGSKGLLELLRKESEEAFEERRRQAKTAGETAGTRLLLPMGMMLAVVLVILTVPAFMSFYA